MADVSRSELDAAIAQLRMDLERLISETARHQTSRRAKLGEDVAAICAALADPDGWVRIAFRDDRKRLDAVEVSVEEDTKWKIRVFKAVIALLLTITLTLLSWYLSGHAPTGAVP